MSTHGKSNREQEELEPAAVEPHPVAHEHARGVRHARAASAAAATTRMVNSVSFYQLEPSAQDLLADILGALPDGSGWEEAGARKGIETFNVERRVYKLPLLSHLTQVELWALKANYSQRPHVPANVAVATGAELEPARAQQPVTQASLPPPIAKDAPHPAQARPHAHVHRTERSHAQEPRHAARKPEVPHAHVEDDEALADGNDMTVAKPMRGEVVTQQTGLRLRAGPSREATILHLIPKGAEVTVLPGKSHQGFFQVSYNGQKGWAHSSYIAIHGDATAHQKQPGRETPHAVDNSGHRIQASGGDSA
jgi:hypothetical protein